jgi:hypothetical protein
LLQIQNPRWPEWKFKMTNNGKYWNSQFTSSSGPDESLFFGFSYCYNF